jgi:putative peptidoglycan lipid II flippase
VTLTIVLGYLFAIPLRKTLGLPATWGAAGLTASAGIAGWVEFVLLRRAVNRRIGNTGIPRQRLGTLWGAAALAAAAAWGIRAVAPASRPLVVGVTAIAAYGAVYFLVTSLAGVEDATDLTTKITRRLGLRRGNSA